MIEEMDMVEITVDAETAEAMRQAGEDLGIHPEEFAMCMAEQMAWEWERKRRRA